ncbi:MAG: two-component regulator propeller domain-containing protein [Bacteroidia bacterium]
MGKYIKVAFLLFILSFSYQNAYTQQYNFINYTVESGLSQDQVLAVCQDDEGVMWFGTNGGGITKYNGINYEYITDKDGLTDNLIYTIAKDKQGRMWVGTNNGLTIIDGKKFKNYTVQNGLNHNRIFTIFFDSQNNVLLGTGKGICLFKEFASSFYHISPDIDSASVVNIYEDSENNFWFSTLGYGVFKFDGKNTINYTQNNGLETNYVYAVMEYKKGVYWFLQVSGLQELKNGTIKNINPANVKDTYAMDYYSFYKEDSSIWLGTNYGIIKINENKVLQFSKDNGLINNDVWKIYPDRESNLWFASKENGVSKLANECFSMYSIHMGIERVFQSKDNRYWLASKDGLAVIDGNKVITYNKSNWNNASNKVTAIAEDKNGCIYIGTGTDEGLIKFDGRTFKRIVTKNNNYNVGEIFGIYIDNKGQILLSTKYGVAKVVNDEIEELKIAELPKGFVYNINQDNTGVYWIATESGLYKWDGQITSHYGSKHGFKAKQAFCIIKGLKNELWIATDAGIYRYDKSSFTQISEKEGLAANQVRSILIDKNGIIWSGLPNGVDRIKVLENGKYDIRHYGIEDGFTGEVCMQNSILLDNQNKIWFGAQKGLMVYQPQYDRRNTLEPLTRITNVLLFGGKTDWKIYADSLDQYNLPINLELNNDRNYLTFTYAGVSLTTPGKVRYKYMLKGLDKDWSEETSKTEAPYTNLEPGEYEFLVRATNGDGVWNKVPASFKFTIAPPFWRTWWFYSIIAFVILSGIYSYVQIRIANNKIVKQKLVIEQKNEALNQANLLIAGKNKSITDSINYALRIQQSFLTSEKTLKSTLSDYFILYKPRDIVSGDFYWAFNLPDRILVACADSTGHGIPGAFMSLIGLSLLNEISHSKKITEPAAIVEELRRIIICALNPEQVDEGGKDGMDLALISIFKKQESEDAVKIHYAGGNSSIYIVSQDDNGQKLLTEFKPDKQPVGYYSNMKPFTQQEIIVKKGAVIYMGTDGFADQFGGPSGKKIMSKQLKAILTDIAHESMDAQHKKLDDAFMNWKGELEQVDDVTIFGIKIS